MGANSELQRLGFQRVGAIRPCDSGRSCRADIQADATGYVVYAHVVGDEIKKFGITSPSLKERVSRNVSSINAVIAPAEGRR